MAQLEAVKRYQLDTLKIGQSVLITGDYTRRFHVRVSSRAQNYAKHMARHGVLITFTTRRAVTEEHGGQDDADGVIIKRVPYKPPAMRPSRRKKKRRLNLMAAL